MMFPASKLDGDYISSRADTGGQGKEKGQAMQLLSRAAKANNGNGTMMGVMLATDPGNPIWRCVEGGRWTASGAPGETS